MATQFHSLCYSRAAVPPFRPRQFGNLFFLLTKDTSYRSQQLLGKYNGTIGISRIKASNGESYLDMWKQAVEREKKSQQFERMAENPVDANENVEGQGKEETPEELERKSREFENLLAVPPEERDRVQKMQLIDRAAAALAAARALLKENPQPQKEVSGEERAESGAGKIDDQEDQQGGKQNGSSILPQSGSSGTVTPGPSFWTWAPPLNDDNLFFSEMKPAVQPSSSPAESAPVLEQERGLDFLEIPFETSTLQSTNMLSLPPLQSLVEVEKTEADQETPHLEEEHHELGVQFSAHAAEAADALSKVNEASPRGVNADGSMWWKETGIEKRPDGVVCKWTLTRGVSADKGTEWENKYWEAADVFGYKELGSEKSGRDAAGNVWREYWRESMMEIEGSCHLEKTADKWGKNMQGDEWQEQWLEHYDSTGRADKWAHKWCSIDPETPLEAGHAHVWHERWGEKYDGQGGSTKYSDKWSERFEGDGWSKWGDKWDENFDVNGEGVKQGETWWEGKYGERWNRTWGEGHNSSGWVHKYGKSSSGEHWDTHVEQDTWYERYPHYGFYHCYENSAQLRQVEKPTEEEY